MRRLLLLGAWIASLACDPQPGAVARAEQRARPHLQLFALFDRWARRAGQSEDVLRDKNALGEAMFAKVRNQRSVLAAWAQIEGDRARLLAWPSGTALPTLDSWISLHDPKLGALRVAPAEPCPLAIKRSGSADLRGRCVLISRKYAAPPQRAITVTVAFSD
jgi:hypothetical protein